MTLLISSNPDFEVSTMQRKATHQDGGHEAEGAESLSEHVALDVPVIVLAGPHIAAVVLDALGHHVVDQSVLVPEGWIQIAVKVSYEVGQCSCSKLYPARRTTPVVLDELGRQCH